MKTKLLSLLTLMVLVFASSACSKKKSGGVVATPVYNYNSNNQCVDQYGNVHDRTLCDNYNSQYRYEWSYQDNCCYQVDLHGNRTKVDQSRCYNNGGQQCHGWYAWVDPHTSEIIDVKCNGNDCSGYNLYSYDTGSYVYCR